MAKNAAFGTLLKMGNGSRQVETATFAGTITGAGNVSVVITCTGLTGTPLTLSVPVLGGDTAAEVAEKALAVLEANAAVSSMFYVGGSGTSISLTRKTAVANIANLNIAIADGTSTGITTAATSTNTVVGGLAEVFTSIAAVTNIGGIPLALDTEDVTTHDSTGAWEEVVVTILRSGEISLDLVFDPTLPTHGSTSGMVFQLENKILSNYKIVFPDTANTEWAFAAYVTSIEPSAPVAGAFTATAKMKVTGQPTLA